jgi:hypothetical protein
MGDTRTGQGQQAGPNPARTLLVLGAKPEPVLPPPGTYAAVACANASGYSAARLGLPPPVFTVMTALLTDGSEAGRQRLAALGGLETGRLVYYARPLKGRPGLARLAFHLKSWRMKPWVLRRALRRVGFRWREMVSRPNADYQALIRRLTGGAAEVAAQLDRKLASSGVVAVAVGLADGRWDRVIVSGFSFELTQAFGLDSNIAGRGQVRSLHRDTDVLVLSHLARRHPVYTTEPVVHAAAAVPMLEEAPLSPPLRY